MKVFIVWTDLIPFYIPLSFSIFHQNCFFNYLKAFATNARASSSAFVPSRKSKQGFYEAICRELARTTIFQILGPSRFSSLWAGINGHFLETLNVHTVVDDLIHHGSIIADIY